MLLLCNSETILVYLIFYMHSVYVVNTRRIVMIVTIVVVNLRVRLDTTYFAEN